MLSHSHKQLHYIPTEHSSTCLISKGTKARNRLLILINNNIPCISFTAKRLCETQDCKPQQFLVLNIYRETILTIIVHVSLFP
jgi:hypothetical protein